MKHANYLHRKLFSISHFAMLLSTFARPSLGWSELEENPAYAIINFDNQPSDAQIISNLQETHRSVTYRNMVESIVAIAQARGIEVALATMAFRVELFQSGVLKVTPEDFEGNTNDPAIYKALQKQVEENNKIVVEIAHKHGATLVDTGSLSAFPELFVDDCHFTVEGHKRRAELLYDVIVSQQRLVPSSLLKN